VRLKRNGPNLREKEGFKEKQANGVGTQLMKKERQVTACTALLPCYYYDVYTSPASGWLSWHPRRFEWTGPFLWKTKSSLCAWAITFQTHCTHDPLAVNMKTDRSTDWLFSLSVSICQPARSPHTVSHRHSWYAAVILHKHAVRYTETRCSLNSDRGFSAPVKPPYSGNTCSFDIFAFNLLVPEFGI
jgi:hypothetical protein